MNLLNSFRNFDIDWAYKLTSFFINPQQKEGNYEGIRGQEVFFDHIPSCQSRGEEGRETGGDQCQSS
jgi:hypothetical protein